MKVVFRRVLPPPLCPRDRPFNQSFEHFSKAAPQIRMVIRHSYLRSQIHLRDILNLNVVKRRRSQLDIVVLLQFHVHLRQMRLCEIRKLFHFTPNHTREEAHPSHPHPLKSIGTSSCRPYSPHLAKDAHDYHISICDSNCTLLSWMESLILEYIHKRSVHILTIHVMNSCSSFGRAAWKCLHSS